MVSYAVGDELGSVEAVELLVFVFGDDDRGQFFVANWASRVLHLFPVFDCANVADVIVVALPDSVVSVFLTTKQASLGLFIILGRRHLKIGFRFDYRIASRSAQNSTRNPPMKHRIKEKTE